MAGMKSLAKDTAIYGVSSIVGRFLNWCLVPLYTNMFAANEYGVVTLLYSYVALVLIILTYGMETGFFRFANHERYDNPMRVYSTSVWSIGATSAVFIALIIAFLTPISNSLGMSGYSDFVAIMAITVALDAFTAIPFSYLRYKKRPIRFASLKLVGIAVNIFLNIFFILICPWLMKVAPGTISWFYNPEYGIGYIFASNLASTLVTVILLLPELLKARYGFDMKLWKEMIMYCLPLLVLGIAGIMNQTVDKILYPYLVADKVEAMHGLGIYGANYKIAIVMVMFTQAFRFAYEPFIFAQNKVKGDNKNDAYSQAMKYFIIFGLLIFLGVMFYMPILKYFIGSKYFEGLAVVPIIMMAEMFFGIFFNLSLWYKLTDHTQWGAWFSLLGAIVTIAGNILFVPKYGYMACAWSAFACYFIMMVVSYVIGQKKYPIKYEVKNAIFYFVFAIALYVVSLMLEFDSEILTLSLRTILLLVYVAVVIKKDMPLREIPIIGKHFK